MSGTRNSTFYALHEDGSIAYKWNARDYSGAARKSASKGMTAIPLVKQGGTEIRHFAGGVEEIAPHEVAANAFLAAHDIRTRPRVKFVGVTHRLAVPFDADQLF